jgi:hypothetical protein
MAAKTGDVVWADFGGGPMLALFVEEDGDKDVVQHPDGSRVRLAYREPEDRDERGSGKTWWKVK